MLNLTEAEVTARSNLRDETKLILGYRLTVLNEEKLGLETVRAVIEVKDHLPERGGGLDRLAERIARTMK